MTPSILIVIPCLNEEAHLPALLDALCADPAAAEARIVVVDGGSSDRSQDIVRERTDVDARVALLPNPQRIQSAGINLAVRTYGGDADVLLRVDAHADYPADFVSRLLAACAETGADSVTVSMRAEARAGRCWQRATATAQNSVLGAGGSPHRKSGTRRWVDHGHHALISMAAFRSIGGYDESFTHNEDAEFDARLVRSGFRILLAADITIGYFPRERASALARQYFNYGRGRARTALKHCLPLKPRQLIPALIAPISALSLLWPATWWAAAPALVWVGACLAYGAWLGLRERSWCAAAAGLPAALMHLAWSCGFLRELVQRRITRARARSAQQTQA